MGVWRPSPAPALPEKALSRHDAYFSLTGILGKHTEKKTKYYLHFPPNQINQKIKLKYIYLVESSAFH